MHVRWNIAGMAVLLVLVGCGAEPTLPTAEDAAQAEFSEIPVATTEGWDLPLMSAAELRRAKGLSFSVRVGINSGEVIAGAIGEEAEPEYTAVGHTVGLAQRMEALAEPGKAYLTEHTAKLVAGYLELDIETEVGRAPLLMRWTQSQAVDFAENGKLLIDTEENRFVVRDVDRLPKRDRERLLRYVYW